MRRASAPGQQASAYVEGCNIMGYVRDIPDRAYFTIANYALSHPHDCPLVFIFYRPGGCVNEAF